QLRNPRHRRPNSPCRFPQTPAPAGGPVLRGTETLLVVDDSSDVRKIAVHILSGLGYRVLEASTAADALHVLTENRGGIDLVFSDVMMPGGMLGTDLARHTRSLYPSIRVLLTSASEDAAPTGAEDFAFVIKPYRRSDLARIVRQMLDRPA
ncbi:MAG: response regulator, partial [Proteobacteria bacterium]|nr:response regulator [Pseudomonadota bacterium]